jgi:hypothetical protein
LQRAAALYRQAAAAPVVDSVVTLLHDPALLAAHRQMLPPGRRQRIDPLNVALLIGTARLAEAECLETVWPTLSPAEKAAVLSDGPAMDRLLALARLDVDPMGLQAETAR